MLWDQMRRRLLAIPALVSAVLYLANASWLAPERSRAPVVYAHRGLGQNFNLEGIDGGTCTAVRILPPEHEYLENTIAGIQAAFDVGADWVEIDLQLTRDRKFAVFHDHGLACRTEGRGRLSEHTLAELQDLDVGYGYTSDGARTYPFRGLGVALMPSLEEVLAAFPQGSFVLEIKGGGRAAGELLASRLSALSPGRQAQFMVYGNGEAVAQVRSRTPAVVTFTRAGVKSCLKSYLVLGWSGWVPRACRNTVVLVPINGAPWLWGWPRRLQARLEFAGSTVVVIGPWKPGERHGRGVDDPALLDKLSVGFDGGVWTNRVDLIGPALADR